MSTESVPGVRTEWGFRRKARSVWDMTAPDYRDLPKRVEPEDYVEEIDVSPPPDDDGLPQPDKDWFNSGG